MKRRTILLGSGALMAGIPPWVLGQAQALEQVALVIGNNNYKDAAQLVNAGRDARLMHDTFTRLGARSDLHLNLNSTDLSKAVTDFVRKIQGRPVGIAWFFFSGHGAALDGKSLLLGTDVSLQTPAALKASGYDLDRLKGLLDQVKPRIAVVVIDACRNNPFQTRALERSTKGLVPKPWDGTLVAYSTAEYTKALDWPQKSNGPYATALAACLTEARARGLEDVFKAASDQVFAQTGREQTPGYYSELRSQVWLDNGKISLRSLAQPATSVSAGNDPRNKAARSLTPAVYRADLQLDDQYAGTSGTEWAEQLYRLETGVPKMDRFESVKVLAKARQRNADDRELCMAGLLLQTGNRAQGVEKNRELAARYFERAASRGHVPAQTLLGELAYERQDYVQSYKWLSVAARSGYGRPVMDLAQLTGEGLGTVKDPQKAMELLMQSIRAIPGMDKAGK
ncbi:caspase family protein [Herbaspirillum autotrophicum]|uniref:caspase family protein n=1 Tax=Herbaspirillum autotrophicum TaxID=180195 RepID=UPI00067CA803|nr:caspase family protein [Herbaspirillum autotrophicum]